MTTLLETENYGLYTLKARMITNFIRCSTTGPTWFGYALSSRRTLTTLNAYFKITDIKEAISDTIEDSGRLRYIIMDISPETDLSKIFRPLDNNQASDVMLQKEKARLKRKYGHSSWLRLCAIKLIQGNYIITGGAIKLTATMQEREHTRQELVKIDKVRRYLLEEGIIDDEGFIEYISEL